MAKKSTSKSKAQSSISAAITSAGKTLSSTAEKLGERGKDVLETVKNTSIFSSPEFESLPKLLENELQDIYSAEQQLVIALPKMAAKASAPKLQQAFKSHLAQTKKQVDRLEKVSRILKINLSGKSCKAMEGLVKEGNEILKATGDGAIIDTALIAAAQRVEHYEMAAYGCARAMAERLGNKQAATLLQQTLDEESAADEKLTVIAEGDVLKRAYQPAKAAQRPAKKAGSKKKS